MLDSLDPLIWLLFIILLFGLGVIGYLLKKQKEQAEILRTALDLERDAHAQQKELLNKLIDIAEESQRRIAMELHDNLGASLNITKSNIEHIKESLPKELSAELANVLHHTTSTLNEIVFRVRNISKDLQPDVLERQGLIGAINDFIQGVMLRRNIEITFSFNTDISHLTSNTELAIYRIVQEAINNTVKYAKAQKLDISLTLEGDRFFLKLRDNGIGFNPSEIKKTSKGIGLLNMEIRAKQIGALFEIQSALETGTTINLHNHD